MLQGLRKAQGLPVNVVVMIIIGLVLFGMGMALFFQISGDAQASVDGLNGKVRSDISRLECSAEQWICSPSIKMNNGDVETFELFIANIGDVDKRFYVKMNLEEIDSGKMGISNSCGAVLVTVADIYVNVKSGFGAAIPFVVQASRVSDECSFTTTAYLYADDDDGNEVGRTPIIIRVQ